MSFRILVPVDDSETSRRTLEALVSNRERFACPVCLLHVVNLQHMAYKMIPDFQVEMVREPARKAGAKLLETLAAPLEQAGLAVEKRLEFGSPRRTICRIADEEGFGLLVLGRNRTGEIRDALFGSVSNHVLHHTHCPVLML